MQTNEHEGSQPQPRGGLGRLDGKVGIVTGAGSRGPGIGIGRAASILLAREGARVGLADHRADWAQATHAMVAESGGEALVLSCDVTDQDSCRAAVAAVLDAYGQIDFLVNNVGVVGPAGSAIEVDPDDWDATMLTNVKSVMLMAKFCVPEMAKAGGGSIVNVSSVGGLQGGHPKLAYATSKGALINMTRAMAAQHGPAGIRVNCVAPGMVFTPLVAERGMTSEVREIRRRQSMLQTEGTGWDVASAIAFLTSDESRWITAVTLPVDAGLSAAIGGASDEHGAKAGVVDGGEQ